MDGSPDRRFVPVDRDTGGTGQFVPRGMGTREHLLRRPRRASLSLLSVGIGHVDHDNPGGLVDSRNGDAEMPPPDAFENSVDSGGNSDDSTSSSEHGQSGSEAVANSEGCGGSVEEEGDFAGGREFGEDFAAGGELGEDFAAGGELGEDFAAGGDAGVEEGAEDDSDLQDLWGLYEIGDAEIEPSSISHSLLEMSAFQAGEHGDSIAMTFRRLCARADCLAKLAVARVRDSIVAPPEGFADVGRSTPRLRGRILGILIMCESLVRQRTHANPVQLSGTMRLTEMATRRVRFFRSPMVTGAALWKEIRRLGFLCGVGTAVPVRQICARLHGGAVLPSGRRDLTLGCGGVVHGVLRGLLRTETIDSINLISSGPTLALPMRKTLLSALPDIQLSFDKLNSIGVNQTLEEFLLGEEPVFWNAHEHALYAARDMFPAATSVLRIPLSHFPSATVRLIARQHVCFAEEEDLIFCAIRDWIRANGLEGEMENLMAATIRDADTNKPMLLFARQRFEDSMECHRAFLMVAEDCGGVLCLPRRRVQIGDDLVTGRSFLCPIAACADGTVASPANSKSICPGMAAACCGSSMAFRSRDRVCIAGYSCKVGLREDVVEENNSGRLATLIYRAIEAEITCCAQAFFQGHPSHAIRLPSNEVLLPIPYLTTLIADRPEARNILGFRTTSSSSVPCLRCMPHYNDHQFCQVLAPTHSDEDVGRARRECGVLRYQCLERGPHEALLQRLDDVEERLYDNFNTPQMSVRRAREVGTDLFISVPATATLATVAANDHRVLDVTMFDPSSGSCADLYRGDPMHLHQLAMKHSLELLHRALVQFGALQLYVSTWFDFSIDTEENSVGFYGSYDEDPFTTPSNISEPEQAAFFKKHTLLLSILPLLHLWTERLESSEFDILQRILEEAFRPLVTSLCLFHPVYERIDGPITTIVDALSGCKALLSFCRCWGPLVRDVLGQEDGFYPSHHLLVHCPWSSYFMGGWDFVSMSVMEHTHGLARAAYNLCQRVAEKHCPAISYERTLAIDRIQLCESLCLRPNPSRICVSHDRALCRRCGLVNRGVLEIDQVRSICSSALSMLASSTTIFTDTGAALSENDLEILQRNAAVRDCWFSSTTLHIPLHSYRLRLSTSLSSLQCPLLYGRSCSIDKPAICLLPILGVCVELESGPITLVFGCTPRLLRSTPDISHFELTVDDLDVETNESKAVILLSDMGVAAPAFYVRDSNQLVTLGPASPTELASKRSHVN